MKEKMEKLPHGKRPEVIIRGSISQEKRDIIQAKYAEQFRGDHYRRDLSLENKELLEKVEYKKRECEKDYISRANVLINEIMIDCGATPFDILEDNIYFVDEAFFKQKFKDAKESNSAFYLKKDQAIVVRGNPSQEPVIKMTTVLHEMIHAKESVSVHAKEDLWGTRRMGMTNIIKKEAGILEIGTGLNEAVVAHLEKKLSRKLFEESDFFEEERRAEKRCKNNIRQIEERAGLSAGDMLVYGVEGSEVQIAAASYSYMRRVLDYLIRGIASEFGVANDQVEKVLYDAYFTGNLSSWAKIKTSIEGTFGKGAFDVIMKMTPDEKSAQEILIFLQQHRPTTNNQSKLMEKKMPVAKSPYEAFMPAKKITAHKERSNEATPQEAFTEEELIRNEAWHGVKRETPKQRATVYSLEEARVRKITKEQIQKPADTEEQVMTREQTVLDAEYIPIEEKKMSASETREAREQEEKEIAVIAQTIFEARMQGTDAEKIDTMLVEQGIKPWTPEAEEFMRKWDWEQAEQKFKELAQEREMATARANEAAPKKHIELHEYEDRYVKEKFAAFNIKPEDLAMIEGFDSLSYGQRLLLAENLHQLTLGRVQEEAVQKFQEDTKQSKFLGRIWKGVTKKYQIAKHEKATVNEITKGGLAYHGELLKQLTEGANKMGFDVVEGKGGTLEFQYVEAHPLMSERQKEDAKEFNRIATAYGKLPYEWSLSTATVAQKREYERVAGQFEKAKEHILKTEQGIIGDKDALLFVADIESKIRLNQFFNTHPDAEKQLQSIESDAVWNKAIGGIVTERGMYFGAGLATRTFAVGLLGAVGFPLAAVGIGGWMGRRRAAESLREREKGARHGKSTGGKELSAMVTADALAKKLEDLTQKINGEADEKKRAELLASLQVRLEYTKHKLDAGAIDFGSVDRRIVNQYGLMDALTTGSSTLAAIDGEQGRVAERYAGEVQKNLDQFLQFKEEKVSKERQDYLRKQMIYGAGLGIAAFSAGYYAKEILHAAGPTEAHAASREPRAQSIMKDHIPQRSTGPRMAASHETIPAGGGIEKGVGSTTAAGHAKEAMVAGTQERGPIVLDIGKRGPEGAFIDELKNHPEIAERLGIKDIGKEAHRAWMEFAKEELKDPRTQELLEKLGYPKDQQGYADMMRRIEHGKISLEERDGRLHMRIDEDSEYLRARPKILSPKGPRGTEDIPVGQQVFGEQPAPTAPETPPIDVDKAFRAQPSGGIESPIPHVEKPIIEITTLVEQQFGMDADEYNAIKGVKVETLLKQISSRDEAWAIWRGDVPGSEITLPHDGIYGAMEFKKHIDLAEHIRALHPSDSALKGDVDAFMQSEMQSKGFNLTKTSTEVGQSGKPVIPAESASNTAEDVDIPKGQQVFEATDMPKNIKPERFALLQEDVYRSPISPAQKIIDQFKARNFTTDDFAEYYVWKMDQKSAGTLMKNTVRQMFEKIEHGDVAEQRKYREGLENMIKFIQSKKQ